MAIVDSQEQRQLEVLVRELGRAANWAKYTGSGPNVWALQRGCDLAADNRRTHPYEVSHRATRAITAAVDNFEGLRVMVLGRTEQQAAQPFLHTFAPLTLLRAVIENSATAVWLLAPAADVRVLRAFRLAAAEVGPSEEIKVLTGAAGPRTKQQRLDAIHQRAVRAGMSPTRTKPSTYAEIVRDAGTHVGLRPKLSEALWRSCSGAAHGDLWPIVSLLDGSDVIQTPTGVIKGVSASTRFLALAAGVSAQLIEFGMRRYGELRSQP